MTCRVDSGLATVTVDDHGCGIEPTHLPHIFERFYRADSSRARSTGGFGLGLAIAKSLVTFYGGQIQAESTLGKGTRMTVCFPVISAHAGSALSDDATNTGASSAMRR